MNISLKVLAPAAVLLPLLGYAFGRFQQPQSLTKTTDVSHATDNTQTTVAVVGSSEHLAIEIHHDTTTTERPDGTKVTVNHDTETKVVVKEVVHETTKTVEVVKTVEVKASEKIVNAKPSWRVSALVTASPGLPASRSVGPSLVQGLPLYYGAMVEKRIVGPVWLGVHAISNRSAGLSVGVEF